MSDNEQLPSENQEQDGAVNEAAEELQALKERATVLGIKFSNNIGVDSLREKINDKLAAADKPAAVDTTAEMQPAPEMPASAKKAVAAAEPVAEVSERKLSLREYMIKEELKLVRVRIQNLNPAKKDLHGEYVTVSNDYLGNVTKFIPFGVEDSENGYHIPNCLYNELKGRMFQNIRTKTDRSTGRIEVTSAMSREYALEVLDPLTQEELADLAKAQLASGSVG